MADEHKNGPQTGNHGKTLLSWQFPEYPTYKRGRSWYFLFSLIGVVLIFWSLATTNFLFAIVVLMVGVILVAQGRRKPHAVVMQITEDGIGMGQDFYRFRDIKFFWIAYDPPLTKKLYIRFKSAFRPILTIQLNKQNPVDVRRVLRTYIDEDLEQEDETTSDSISRLLKI